MASSLNNQAGYDLIQSGCGQFSSWLLQLYMSRIIPNQRPVLRTSSQWEACVAAGYLRRSHKSDRTISIIPAQSGVTQTLSPSSVLASDGSKQITCLWWALPAITVKKAFIRGLGCYVVRNIFNNIFLLSSLFFVWFIHWDLAFPVSKTSREGCLWHLCPHIFSEIPSTYTATFWHEFCWGHEYKIVLNIWN